ncbi:MAG: PQQ-binding-like beta-propeller repeat protein [Phycisphaerales bacterium]|nr:PQQ-binding-like beta-propeller repeat protein [Phycisphaerales bacterium]
MQRPVRWWLLLMFSAAGLACVAPSATAQITTSYVDDSVLARESLSRLADLMAAGNIGEAARVIQAVLDTETDRVIETAGDANLYIGVRTAIHAELLARPDLLERYRRNEEPIAEALLAEGRLAEVERSRLLTRSGFESALRLTQEHIEFARFEAARLLLEQLDQHPDRKDPELSPLAAQLAREIARYLPRPAVQALAQRWADEAKVPPGDLTPVPWPAAWKESIGRDSTGRGPAPAIDGLVEGPLQSAYLSSDASADFRAAQDQPRDDIMSSGRTPWAFPMIVGDDVVVNDGRAVTAFDRFTLSALWRKDFSESARDSDLDAEPDPRSAGYMRVEEANTVAAAEGVAVAAMGILSQQSREGNNQIHGVEIATGRPLWSIYPGDIADTLRLAETRGPVVIDQTTAIITLRKDSAARRLLSTYMAGVDLWSGKTRWLRLIGSAGSLGSFSTRPGETPIIHEGIIYRGDDAGLVCAIEAATGRVRWIRILKGEAVLRAGDSSPPFASQAPVIDGDSIIVLAPAQRGLCALSMQDGKIVATRDMAGLPLPIHYLLSAGSGAGRRLVVVSNNQMAMLPLPLTDSSRGALVPAVGEPGFLGRIVVMDDTLAAPIPGGLLLAKAAAPREPQFRPLAHTGNLVSSGSNLLVADTWRLHSFLSWDDADALLSARMKADPADPRPALALAELAYRAQHFDRLLPAADHALSALIASPQSAITQQVKPRLFTSLLDMVRAATSAPLPNPAQARPEPRINDLTLVDALVTRLERVAETPTETLQWLVSLGALREIEGKPSDACAAYQRIIEDPRLAENPWRQASPPIRGRQLAITSLRRVIGSMGIAAYARFSAELDAEFAALPEGLSAEELEALASRYPVATRTPELWLRAAASHRARGDILAAASALARSADVGNWLVTVGISPDQVRLGEVIGCQVETLAALGRPMTATQILMRSAKSRSGMPITCGGTPINPTARAAEFRQSAITAARLPRIGSEPRREVDVITGWMLTTDILREGLSSPPTSHEWVLMQNFATRQLGVFADAGNGKLSAAWTRSFPADPPTILLSGTDAIYVYWNEDTTVERIDPASGETVWKSAPFTKTVPPGPATGIRMIDTPLDGPVRSIEIIAALRDRVLVLTQHDGATAAYDTTTGNILFTLRTPLTRVYDVALSGTTLVFAGATDPRDTIEPDIAPDRREPRVAPRPVVLALDAHTGRTLYEAAGIESDVRWIRATRDVLAIGQADRIRGLELATGKPLWPDIVADDVAEVMWAAQSVEGWVFDDRLYVLSRLHGLYQVSLRTGEHAPLDLRASERMPDAGGKIIAGKVGPNIAFSTQQGVMLFSPEGKLVGANTVPARQSFRPATVSEHVIAMVDHRTDELADGRLSVRIMLVSADSAKLLRTLSVILHGEPEIVNTAIVDGKLILTTDAITQVIALPELPKLAGGSSGAERIAPRITP